jgi:hypothetical protein
VSEREIRKEMLEHPWASREIAMRIALDHKRRPKTTTKEGKRLYMKDYMRLKRQAVKPQAFPSVSDMIGLKVPKRRR